MRFLLSLFLALSLLPAGGCEDDPILDPGDADDNGGGSYSSIAPAPADSASSAPDVTTEDNPALF